MSEGGYNNNTMDDSNDEPPQSQAPPPPPPPHPRDRRISYAHCSICLSSETSQDGSPWVMLYHCGHIFHQDCLLLCEKEECPLCKTTFQMTNVRAIYLDGNHRPHTRMHHVTESEIIRVIRDISETDTSNSLFMPKQLMDKLLRYVGIYGITHDNLEVSFIGVSPAIYRRVTRSFSLGQAIRRHGTDIPMSLIDWKDGVTQMTT